MPSADKEDPPVASLDETAVKPDPNGDEPVAEPYPTYSAPKRLVFLEIIALILLIVVVAVPPSSQHGASAIIQTSSGSYYGVLR